MRAPLLGLIAFFLLASGVFRLHAQTNTHTNVQPPNPQAAISFLTPAQQLEYATARAKALADNPQIKTEGENLMQQGEALMADGTAADKQAFIEKMDSHRQKLRQAMLKEDPNLGPIFTEIDQHLLEMKAKQQGSSGANNAPAAGPASH